MEMDHIQAIPTQAQFLQDPGVKMGDHLQGQDPLNISRGLWEYGFFVCENLLMEMSIALKKKWRLPCFIGALGDQQVCWTQFWQMISLPPSKRKNRTQCDGYMGIFTDSDLCFLISTGLKGPTALLLVVPFPGTQKSEIMRQSWMAQTCLSFLDNNFRTCALLVQPCDNEGQFQSHSVVPKPCLDSV